MYGSAGLIGYLSGNTLTVAEAVPGTGSTIAAAGSGYTNATGTMTWSGSNCSTNPVLNVTATGGTITKINSVTTKGVCFASVSGASTWTPSAGLGSGTGFEITTTMVQALPVGGPPASGPITIGQTITGSGITAAVLTAGSGYSWTFGGSTQTVGSASAPVASIQANSWYPEGVISNNASQPDYTMRTLRSGTASNTDLTGRIALSGGTASYTLTQTYASAPDCITADVTTPANASSVSESTTALTFTGTGTDTIKWICVGRL
jgi:hypothetical protein